MIKSKSFFVSLFVFAAVLFTQFPAGAETVYDRVCVADAAYFYDSPELDDILSPRVLEYWDFVVFAEASENSDTELILVDGFDEWWVSTEEVRPLYRVTREAELIVPKMAKSEDGDGTVEHMGILDYLEPGELVALSVQPLSALGGYLLIETEDCDIGFVLEDAIEPVGDPGKR